MVHRLLADALVVAHLGSGCSVTAVQGGRSVDTSMGWTPLENLWRQRAGQDGYAGGFVEHYLVPLIYPAGLTPRLQLALAALVLGINVLVYGIVAARRRRGRRHAGSATGAGGPT